MMFVKAHRVAFDLTTGKKVSAPASFGMLHDPEGKVRAKNVVLVTKYGRSATPVKLDADMSEYFGSGYKARSATVNLPPASLESWKKLGEVKTIYYVRTGQRAPGAYYHHFGKGAAIEHKIFRGEGKKPVLYRCGKSLLLLLPEGSTLNWRGFVWP